MNEQSDECVRICHQEGQKKHNRVGTGELSKRVVREFQLLHSREPDFIAAAPGRVNLIGEHIDYNDGFVLPMAVERYVVIAVAPRNDKSKSATFFSVNLAETATVNLEEVIKPQAGRWSNYVAGVVSGFKDLGFDIPAFDAVILSEIPLGGGLSSSAALEVATATLLEALTETRIDPSKKAILCQQAEHRFAGVPCGIMDQFSSVFGRPNELMLLDCRSQVRRSVPFATNDISVMIADTNVKHELAGGEYAERRKQCDRALTQLGQASWRDVTMRDIESAHDVLGETEYRRARHVVGEIKRTTEAASAFQESDWTRVGELMYASHASLRDDYDVSCDELDAIVEIGHTIGRDGGVVGSRMTGGGFGGCTVSLVETEKVGAVSRMFVEEYQANTGITPHCFASRPARGAHVMRPHENGAFECFFDPSRSTTRA